MMVVSLDCTRTTAEIHETLAAQLHFPEWYGKNLDALFDCLTTMTQEVHFTVLHSAEKPQFLRVLLDSSEINPYITVHQE